MLKERFEQMERDEERILASLSEDERRERLELQQQVIISQENDDRREHLMDYVNNRTYGVQDVYCILEGLFVHFTQRGGHSEELIKLAEMLRVFCRQMDKEFEDVL